MLLLSIAAAACRRSVDDDLARFLRNQEFLSRADDFVVWDDVVGHVHKPYALREYKWAEHEDGHFALETNNLGFREDQDTPIGKPEGEIRVLVTGDSHTDGVVPNSESFVNLLEADLNSRFEEVRFNVLNAGVGHYGPYHYPRVLEKFLILQPDFFVVTFYLGNDFLDACRLLEGTGQAKNRRPRGYYRRLQAYTDQVGQGRSQSLNQIYYFAHFPRMMDAAVGFADRQFRRLMAFANSHGVPVLVVLLPSKLDVEHDLPSQEIELARQVLELSEEDLALNLEAARRLTSVLRSQGIEYLDLAGYLVGRGPGLYWQRDQHLSTRGHRAVAEILSETYRSRFEQLAAARLGTGSS